MNRLSISGNLTREPELSAPNNSEYTCIKFSIANNDESKKNQNGAYENVVSFYDCEFWTKNPQHWLNKLKKGTGIAFDGRLKQNRWENKEGQKKSKIICIVEKFPLLIESKKQEQEQYEESPF